MSKPCRDCAAFLRDHADLVGEVTYSTAEGCLETVRTKDLHTTHVSWGHANEAMKKDC